MKYSMTKFEKIGSTFILFIPITLIIYFFKYESLDFIDATMVMVYVMLSLTGLQVLVIGIYSCFSKDKDIKLGLIIMLFGGWLYLYCLGGIFILLNFELPTYIYFIPLLIIVLVKMIVSVFSSDKPT